MKPIDPSDPFDRPASVQVVAAPERNVSLGVVAALIGGGAGLLGAGVLLGVYVTTSVTPAAIREHHRVPPVPPVPTAQVIETHITPPIPSGPPRSDRRRIEVAFVMDTTGSMSGMLKAARQKAWSIVNALADLEPRPEVAVGLVAFRDHNDDYVTRATPLTTDVDAFYQVLHGLKALGGGSKPEAIDEALRVAVRDLGWSAPSDPRTSRLIVVIGDAPPHESQPGVAEALAAHAAGINVSTIQIGDDPEATRAFLELAKAGGGGALTVQPSAQGRLAEQVVTPLDAEIAALQRRIEATVVPYGTGAQQGKVASQLALNSSLGQEEYSSRASALCKTGGFYEDDLLDALDAGRMALANVRRELVSPERARALWGPGDAFDRATLHSLRAERAAVREQLALVVARRDAWLRTNGAREGLDARLLDCIRQHAASAR